MSNPAEAWQDFIAFEDKHGKKLLIHCIEKYRAMKRASKVEYKRKPIPRAWVEQAFIKQHHHCSRCGAKMIFEDIDRGLVVGDHRIALAQGGKHTKKNVVAAHKLCNEKKSSNDLVKESKLTGRTVLQQLENNQEKY